ncbi:MAG: cation:proton antiporter [Chloroflexi bacterium]|nr:cation:proton antiporter [Chloroflexota bacterium]|tara:strand:+ start:1262 stop:1507 length:246 start_codon:yes stop_codon:yes gene_type:complete
MIWWIELLLFGLLITSAVVALQVKDMIAAVASLSVYSFLAASLLALMGAVDVALTEAALGAGVTGVLLTAAISVLRRRSVD